MPTDPFAVTPPPVRLAGVPDATLSSFVRFMDGQDPLNVPVITVPWMDERQTCKIVHEYLAGDRQGTPDDWIECSLLKHGYCSMNGKQMRSPCLFEEHDDSEGWQKARQWEYTTAADGRRILKLKEKQADA